MAKAVSLTFLAVVIALVWLPGCLGKKAGPRVPLPLGPGASQAVLTSTDLGTKEFRNGRFTEAKTFFEQAVAGAPTSGEAHYNLGLALHALGETDHAKEHFIEAANLAPGNKVIWDSPALRPFGSPEPSIVEKPKEQPPGYGRRGLMGGGIGR